MQQSGSAVTQVPAFAFRIAAADVENYRHALGVGGTRVPFGMALRALASDAVRQAIKRVAAGRHPIHVAQEYKATRHLRTGVDYTCDVRLYTAGEDRLRIEQRLADSSGSTCLLVVADIMLVSP